MYTIEYAVGAADDLKGLRARDRSRLLDRIEEQLTHEPARETRNRKTVAGLEPPWEHRDPVWELRVGEYRVFYDVDEAEVRVVVRAIRRKLPHKTTEEIL
jgi:mRNA-degrading endonuclease RelE of RelBE toxin-antitoxin system